MKKIVILALALIFALSLAACGGGGKSSTPSGGNNSTSTPPTSNNRGNASAINEWPDNVFTQQLPKASFKVKDTDANVTNEQRFYIITLDGSETYETMIAYKDELKAAGFTVDEYFNKYDDSVDKSTWFFDFAALNSNGWKVAMGYNPETNAVNQFVITKPSN